MIELNDRTLKIFEQELKKINRLATTKQSNLENLHYNTHGHLEMTNSHVAVRLMDVHEEDEYDVDDYPDLNHVFEETNEYNDKEIKVPTDVLKQASRTFKSDKQNIMEVRIGEDTISLVSVAGHLPQIGKIDIEKNKTVMEEPVSFGVSPEYLYNMMMFFGKFGVDEVTLKYNDIERPLLFKHENLEYIINPIIIKW